jgi:hypothetical protein
LKVTAPYTAGGGDELIYVFLNWTGTGTPVSLACKECAAALSGLKPMAGCTATAGGATTPAKFGEGGAKVEITQASKIPWLTIF